MLKIKENKFLLGNKILIILDNNNDILMFEYYKENDKEWINSKGKNLSKGENFEVTPFFMRDDF
jgi:hypothetical protein